MPETITLDVDLNVSMDKLISLSSELNKLKEQAQSLPDFGNVLSQNLDNAISTVSVLSDKIRKARDEVDSDKQSSTLAQIHSGIQDLEAYRNLYGESGSFSVAAGSVFLSQLESTVQQQLKQLTPQLMNAVKTLQTKVKQVNIDNIVRQLTGSKEIEEIYGRSGIQGSVFEDYMRKVVVPNALRASQFSEFREMRYGTGSVKTRAQITPRELMPKSYLGSYDAGGYVGSRVGRNKIIGDIGRQTLAQLISENDAAARAAMSVSGMIQFDEFNNPTLSKQINQTMVNAFRKRLLSDLTIRANGQRWQQTKGPKRDMYAPTDKNIDNIVSSMTSGPGGKILDAMKATEMLVDSSSWVAADRAAELADRRIQFNAKRELEHYGIGRYSFADLAAGRTNKRQIVAIDESDATRAIGGFKHNQFSDKVIEISISGENGYDRNNAEHRAFAEKIWKPGQTFKAGGQEYTVQTLHGTGEHAIVRAIRVQDKQRAEAEQRQRLIDAGMPEQVVSQLGGYFNNFIPDNFEFANIKEIRKHIDAMNKSWTGQAAQRKPISGARFALVNTEQGDTDFADGTGWMIAQIMDNMGAQMRPGIGAKGTNVVVGNNRTKQIGQWRQSLELPTTINSHIKDKNGNDIMVDLNQVQGLLSYSQVKNKPLFQQLINMGYDPNEAATIFMRVGGLSQMLSHENAEHGVEALKQQATTFMKLSPGMMFHQAAVYQQMAKRLNTPVGIRELLGDNVLGRELDEGRIDPEDPRIAAIRNNELQSIRSRLMRGELIDETGKQLSNGMMTTNSVINQLQMEGMNEEQMIGHIRGLIKKNKKLAGKEYTDDQIRGMFQLTPGSIVDFSHENDSEVAVLRSPNGYDQFVYGKNYAQIARPVFEALGIQTQGVQLNPADYYRIRSDFDGDQVKTASGAFAQVVKETNERHAEAKKWLKEHTNIDPDKAVLEQKDAIDAETMKTLGNAMSGKHGRLAMEAALDVVMGMGATSAAGERAMMMGADVLMDKDNLQAAVQAVFGYDQTTTDFKNAKKTVQQQQIRRANALGKQFQKLGQGYAGLFDVSELRKEAMAGADVGDYVDQYAHKDIFTASNGTRINLRALRNLNVSQINLPSRFQDSTNMGLFINQMLAEAGVDTSNVDAVMEALDYIGYGEAGEATKKLMKTHNEMLFGNFLGTRGATSRSEEKALNEMYADAEREITEKYKKQGLSGKKLKDAVRYEMREYGLHTMENHLHNFGIRDSAIDANAAGTEQNIVKSMHSDGSYRLSETPWQQRVQSSEQQAKEMSGTLRTIRRRRDRIQTDIAKGTIEEDKTATESSLAALKEEDKALEKAEQTIEQAIGQQAQTRSEQTQTGYNTGMSAQDIMEMQKRAARREEVRADVFRAMSGFNKDGRGSVRSEILGLQKPQMLYRDLQTRVAMFRNRLNQPENEYRQIEEKQADDKLLEELNQSMREGYVQQAFDNSIKSLNRIQAAMGPGQNPNKIDFAGLRQSIQEQKDYQQVILNNGLDKEIKIGEDKTIKLSEVIRANILQSEAAYAQVEKRYLGAEGLRGVHAAKWRAEQDYLAAQERINEIKNSKNIQESEKQRRLEGYAPYMLSKEEYIKTFGEDAYNANQSLLGQQAAAQLFATQMRGTVPRRAYTLLGRSVNASMNKMIGAESAYANASVNVERIQNEISRAYSAGDFDKVGALQISLQKAELEQGHAKWSNGLLGFFANTALGDRITRDNKFLSEQKVLDSMEAYKKSYQYSSLSAEDKKRFDNNLTDRRARFERNLSENGFGGIKDVGKDLSSATAAMSGFNAVSSAFTGTVNAVGQTVRRFAAQFGRRIFYNAIREATQFVKQYDTIMKQIQAITFKSDEEMAKIQTEQIEQAIRLKVSPTQVAQVKSDLYRQGLQDQEVENRTEGILKFATVTGTKVQAATKIITTALQNDLVNQAEKAMDVLTALGDSAATTAEEIGKGMQKSAAAAKVAGVSYEELATMLTVITSKTQLGGNQAGTSLQAIFTRMHRVSTTGLAKDEAGESVGVNDVEKALKSAGVALRKENGDFRNTTEVLRDLAKVWNELNDIQKNAVMYAMAGGRQSNMFASLMEGLSEDNGKEFDKLLGLADDSEGLTQSKYEIAVSGVNGALQELKATWDQLISTLVENGQLQNILNTITKITSVVGNIIENMGAGNALLSAMITLMGAAIIKSAALLAIESARAAASAGANGAEGYTAALRAAAVGTAIIGVLAAVGGATSLFVNQTPQVEDAQRKADQKTEAERKAKSTYYSKMAESYGEKYDKVKQAYDVVDKYIEKHGTKITQTTDNTELNNALAVIAYNAGIVQDQFSDLADVANKTSAQLEEMKRKQNELSFKEVLNEIVKSGDMQDQIAASVYKEMKNQTMFNLISGGLGFIPGQFAIGFDENSTHNNHRFVYTMQGDEMVVGTIGEDGSVYYFDSDKTSSKQTVKNERYDESKWQPATGFLEMSHQQLSTALLTKLILDQENTNPFKDDRNTFEKITEFVAKGPFKILTDEFEYSTDLYGTYGLRGLYSFGSLLNQTDLYNYPDLLLYATAFKDNKTTTAGQRSLVDKWLNYYATNEWITKYITDNGMESLIQGDSDKTPVGISLIHRLQEIITNKDKKFNEEDMSKARDLLFNLGMNFASDMFGDTSFTSYMDLVSKDENIVDTILGENSPWLTSARKILNDTQIEKILRPKLIKALLNGENVALSANFEKYVRESAENPYEGLSINDFDYQLLAGENKYGFFENTEEQLFDSLVNQYGLSPEDARAIIKQYYSEGNDLNNLFKKDKNGSYKLSTETTSDIIGQIEQSKQSKDYEYRDEAIKMLNLIQSSDNPNDLFARIRDTRFPNLQPFLKAYGLEDAFIQMNNADGRYNMDYVQNKIREKLFGASETQMYNNRRADVQTIDQMYYTYDQLRSGNMSSNVLQTVSGAINKSEYWVKTHANEALSLYDQQISDKKRENETAALDDLFKIRGQLNTDIQLQDDDVEKLIATHSEPAEIIDITDTVQDFLAQYTAGAQPDESDKEAALQFAREYARDELGIVSPDNVYQEDGQYFVKGYQEQLEERGIPGYEYKEGKWYKKQTSFDEYYATLDKGQKEKQYIDRMTNEGYQFGIDDNGNLTISGSSGVSYGFDKYTNARNFDTIRTAQQSSALTRDVMGKYSDIVSKQEYAGRTFAGKTMWDKILELGEDVGLTPEEAEWIKQNNPDLFRYMNMDENQRAQKEGQALEQKLNIEASVAGLSDLEQMGDLLEGTTQMVENLQKNGRIKIEAQFEMKAHAFQEGQQLAKLFGGSQLEQDQAAMQILHMSEEQFYANAEANRRLARSTARSADYINPLIEEYKTLRATDAAAADAAAKEAGLEWDDNAKTYTFDENRIKLHRGGFDMNKRYLASDTIKLLGDVSDFRDWNTAQKALNLDAEDVAQIKNAAPTYYEWLNLTEEQKRSDYGKLLEQKAKIELSVIGVSELEELGNVAQGTSQIIQDLQKHSDIKIKAEFQIASNVSQLTDLSRQMAYGTMDEQIDAISQLSGIQDRTFIRSNFARLSGMFGGYTSGQRESLAKQLEEWYATAKDDKDKEFIDFIASENGFISKDEELTGKQKIGPKGELSDMPETKRTYSVDPNWKPQDNGAYGYYSAEQDANLQRDVLGMAQKWTIQEMIDNGRLTSAQAERLKKVNPNLYEYANKQQEDKWQDIGKAQYKDLEYNVEVNGIEAMEKLGKVAQGTADIIRRLKQGGIIKIEAEFELRNKAYQEGQTIAQMLYGTDEQKARAAVQLGVASEQEASGKNRAGVIMRGEQYAERLLADKAVQLKNQRNLYRRQGLGYKTTDDEAAEYGLVWDKKTQTYIPDKENPLQLELSGYDYAPRFTTSESQQLAKRIMKYNSWKDAIEGLSLTPEQQTDFQKNNPIAYEYLNLQPTQQRQPEGQAMLHDAEVNIDVMGVEELEKAGKVAEGTKQMLTDLQSQDYNVRIKAEMQIVSMGQSIESDAAMAMYGTRQQQVKALASKYNQDEAYVDANFDFFQAIAAADREQDQNEFLGTLEAIYNNPNTSDATRANIDAYINEHGIKKVAGIKKDREGETKVSYDFVRSRGWKPKDTVQKKSVGEENELRSRILNAVGLGFTPEEMVSYGLINQDELNYARTNNFEELTFADKIALQPDYLSTTEGKAELQKLNTGLLTRDISAKQDLGLVQSSFSSDMQKMLLGGVNATEARQSMSKEAYDQGQILAQLFNGSEEEQIKAAARILNLDEGQATASDIQRAMSSVTNGDYLQRMVEQVQTREKMMAQTGDTMEDIIAYANSMGLKRLNNGSYVFDRNVLNLQQTGYDYGVRYLAGDTRQLLGRTAGYRNWNAMLDAEHFTNSQIEEIKRAAPSYYEWMNLSEKQKGTAEGERLRQKGEIEMKIIGLSEMEEFGDIAQGTADLIERLNKHGTIKIKAEVEMANQDKQFGRTVQDLYSGDRYRQVQAMAQLLDMSVPEVLSDFSANYTAAVAMANAQKEERGQAWIKKYNTASPEQQEQILADAKNQGFDLKIGDTYVRDKPFNIWDPSTWFARKTRGATGYKYDENAVDQISPFLTGERIFTASDMADIFAGYNIDSGFKTTNQMELEAAKNAGYTHITQLETLRAERDKYEKGSAEYKAAEERFNTYKAQYEQEILDEQIQAQMKALEEAGKVTSGTTQLFSNLSSNDYQTRLQAIASLQATMLNTGTAQNYIAAMQQNAGNTSWWYTQGTQMIDKMGEMGVIDKTMIDYYKDPKNADKLKKAVEEYSKTINESLTNQLSAMGIDMKNIQGIDNILSQLDKLGASGDQAAQQIAMVVRYLVEAAGLHIDDKGKFATNETALTTDSMLGAANNAASGYFSNQRKREIRNAIATYSQTEGATYKGLQDYLMEQGLIASYDEWEKYIGQDTEMTELMAKYIGEDQIPGARPDKKNYRQDWEYAQAVNDWALRKERLDGLWFDEDFTQGAVSLSDLSVLQHDMKNENEYEKYKEALAGGISTEELATISTTDTEGTFGQWLSQLTQWQEIQTKLHDGVAVTQEDFHKLNAEVNANRIRDWKMFDEYTDSAADGLMALAAGGAKAKKELQRINSEGRKMQNAKWAIGQAKGKTGAQLGQKERGLLASFGFASEDDIKEMQEAELQKLVDQVEASVDEQFAQQFGGELFGVLQTAIDNYNQNHEIPISLGSLDVNVDGQLDPSEIEAAVQTLKDDALTALWSELGVIGALYFQLTKDKNGIIAELTKGKVNSKAPSGGGGGGGGKSDAQKLLERLKREKEIQDHRLKMLQYEESYYEGRGELGKLNDKLLPIEQDLRTKMIEDYKKAIEELRAQLDKTKKGSDDWYNLVQAILSYEEAIEECENAIDELDRKMRENLQTIIKTRTALEESVEQEYNNRIQQQRDMLQGTVSMQEMIIEAIRQRYQEEWDLIKKDIDRKRQALEEEKSLIDERLNKRKEAEDEAEKYEELMELRRQYAMIAMDSTRTKDAAEMRKKIADIEKEIAWDTAEDEARAQEEALEDQINAYDQYTQNGDEDLEAWLENANNFAVEVNSIITDNETQLFDWMKENVKEYANSLNEAQKNMLLSWDDTYKQMFGIVDKFWTEIRDFYKDMFGLSKSIDEVLVSRDEFLSTMKESQDYQIASEAQRKVMEMQWEDEYDAYVNAHKTRADWSHDDDFDDYGTEGSSQSGSKAKKYLAKFGQVERRFDSLKDAQQWLKEMENMWKSSTDISIRSGYGNNINSNYAGYLEAREKAFANMPKSIIEEAYKFGGLVDYTGPAWVDGTPTRPEAFLSADDTELMRGMLDSMSYVKTHAYNSNIDSSMFTGGGMSIENLDITITEAEFKEDADYEKVAQRVGEAFVKELNRQGMSTANYSF